MPIVPFPVLNLLQTLTRSVEEQPSRTDKLTLTRVESQADTSDRRQRYLKGVKHGVK